MDDLNFLSSSQSHFVLKKKTWLSKIIILISGDNKTLSDGTKVLKWVAEGAQSKREIRCATHVDRKVHFPFSKLFVFHLNGDQISGMANTACASFLPQLIHKWYLCRSHTAHANELSLELNFTSSCLVQVEYYSARWLGIILCTGSRLGGAVLI